MSKLQYLQTKCAVHIELLTLKVNNILDISDELINQAKTASLEKENTTTKISKILSAFLRNKIQPSCRLCEVKITELEDKLFFTLSTEVLSEEVNMKTTNRDIIKLPMDSLIQFWYNGKEFTSTEKANLTEKVSRCYSNKLFNDKLINETKSDKPNKYNNQKRWNRQLKYAKNKLQLFFRHSEFDDKYLKLTKKKNICFNSLQTPFLSITLYFESSLEAEMWYKFAQIIYSDIILSRIRRRCGANIFWPLQFGTHFSEDKIENAYSSYEIEREVIEDNIKDDITNQKDIMQHLSICILDLEEHVNFFLSKPMASSK